MSKVIAEEDSRSKYWFVIVERSYPFPTPEAAALFAEKHNGKVIDPEEEIDEVH